MFEPYEQGGPANAFRYKGIPVRFTYRIDIGATQIGGVDIDGVLPGETQESRFLRYDGPFNSRPEALQAAQEWTAKFLDRVVEGLI